MNWLNYHHLLYFWVVAREGSISRACAQLHVAQPTVSSQLKKLEKSIGDKLFKRVGRNLVLTETGQLVLRYADEIFSLGQELTDTLRGRPTGSPLRFLVGVTDVLPKLVAYRLLKPAMLLPDRVQLTCDEGKLDDLLMELAAHRLDIVLSDSPIRPTVNVKAFSHLLGECAVTIFGKAELARKFRRGFPMSLDGAPFLLPLGSTASRRSLEHWFQSHNIRPQVVAEFEDNALLKVFAQEGTGVFAAPTAIEKETCRQYRVRPIGELAGVKERYYAISVERKLKHPAVVAISDAAREELFS
ncbi:MAG TPA: transcriptional activator NhaR [Thermoguttaceae bacterium]|nr:transcriptional activator NhaR [Thermoguttaceae bacterium]